MDSPHKGPESISMAWRNHERPTLPGFHGLVSDQGVKLFILRVSEDFTEGLTRGGIPGMLHQQP